MKLNFHYSASDYLSNWVNYDHRFNSTLGYRPECRPPENSDCLHETLIEASRVYGVARNFKSEPAGIRRLGPLRTCLAEIQSVPVNDDQAIKAVVDLVKELRKPYEKNLFSAASKFLWFRFKSPIVIYDQYAYDGLKKKLYRGSRTDFFKDNHNWYANYVYARREKYAKHEEQIRTACQELKQFKRFTAAAEMPDYEIDKWVDNPWFRERVFDFYLQSLGEPGSRFEPGVSTH